MMARILLGDTVQVVAGADKGKTGKVLKLVDGGARVVVEGVNLRVRHMRKSQQNPKGGRVRKEASIDASNVMPIDPESGRPTRVAFREVDGKKVRVARGSGKPLAAPDRR